METKKDLKKINRNLSADQSQFFILLMGMEYGWTFWFFLSTPFTASILSFVHYRIFAICFYSSSGHSACISRAGLGTLPAPEMCG
jgi:hypothetical protein